MYVFKYAFGVTFGDFLDVLRGDFPRGFRSAGSRAIVLSITASRIVPLARVGGSSGTFHLVVVPPPHASHVRIVGAAVYVFWRDPVGAPSFSNRLARRAARAASIIVTTFNMFPAHILAAEAFPSAVAATLFVLPGWFLRWWRLLSSVINAVGTTPSAIGLAMERSSASARCDESSCLSVSG